MTDRRMIIDKQSVHQGCGDKHEENDVFAHGSIANDVVSTTNGEGVFGISELSDSKNLVSLCKRCVKINLLQLPADGCVRIWLRDFATSSWATGDRNADLVGLGVEARSRGDILKFNNFIITSRELIFSVYAMCDEIAITIWVRSEEDVLRGYVDLPLGASATFHSEVDRTSLIGSSSFSLDLPV